MRKNRIISGFVSLMQKKYNACLKAGIRVLAEGVALTKA